MRTRSLFTGLLAMAAFSVLALTAKTQTLVYPYPSSPVVPFVFPYLLPQSSLAGLSPLNPVYLSGPAFQLGNYDYFGFLNPGYPNNFYNASFGPFDIPRTSDAIEARLEKDNTLWVGWQGNARMVSRIQVDLLDKDRKTIAQKTITQLPAEARLPFQKQAVSYRITVEYVNGTVTAVTSPIGEIKAATEKQEEPETNKAEPDKSKENPASVPKL